MDGHLTRLSVIFSFIHIMSQWQRIGFQKPAPVFSEYVSTWHDKLQLEVKRCETYWKLF